MAQVLVFCMQKFVRVLTIFLQALTLKYTSNFLACIEMLEFCYISKVLKAFCLSMKLWMIHMEVVKMLKIYMSFIDLVDENLLKTHKVTITII